MMQILQQLIHLSQNKKSIDHSGLFIIQSSFDLLHADIANIKLLTKSAVDPIYFLIFIDLFISKTYTYLALKLILKLILKKSILAKKMEEFYDDINETRYLNKMMRLQTDLEFQQNNIKRLHKKYNVDMFSTRLPGKKAFAAEQKIRELKKLLLKSKSLNKKRIKLELTQKI